MTTSMNKRMINQQYLDNLPRMQMNKTCEKFTYNALDYTEIEVDKVMEIKEDIIKHVEDCIRLKRPFNIGITAAMKGGKTLLSKHLNKYFVQNNIAKGIYISPYNILNYQELSNNILYSDTGEIEYAFNYQKLFVGKEKDNIDYNNLNGDVIITNINNILKAVKLMNKENEKFYMIIDEVHVILLEYIFRNSNNIAQTQQIKIMSQFEKLLQECSSTENNNCIGIIYMSATMEVLSYADVISFTKMYDLKLRRDKRVQVELLETSIVEKFDTKNIFLSMKKALERRSENSNSLQVFYWNAGLKSMKNMVDRLNKYSIKTGKFQNIDFEKDVEIIHADNIDSNKTYEDIVKYKKVPDNVKILITSSLLAAGVNIEIKDRAVDITTLCDEKAFTGANETQIVGRFREGVRLLELVTTHESRKNIMYYKTFLEKERDNFTKKINFAINFLETFNHVNEEDKVKELITYQNNNKLDNVFNYINVVNNKYEISKLGVYGYLYIKYNREHTLKSVKGLVNYFYHNSALNVNIIAEPKVTNFTEVDNESFEATKEKVAGIDDDKDKKRKEIRNKIKEIKENADKELIALIDNSLDIKDASNDNVERYNFLISEDSYKLSFVKKCMNESDDNIKAEIINLYLEGVSKTKIEEALNSCKIIKNRKKLSKIKNEAEKKEMIEALTTVDLDNLAAEVVNSTLDNIFGKDDNLNAKYVNKTNMGIIYKALFEKNALKQYDTKTEIDSFGIKRTIRLEYSGSEEQIKELRRCLSLVTNLKNTKKIDEIRISSRKI